MNRFRLSLLAATLAVAGAAWAQSTPPAGPGSPMGHGPHQGSGHAMRDHGGKDGASWQQRHEQRLGALKKELQLSPEQEPAWNEFTRALAPAAMPQRPDREALAKLPTPERIDQMRALRQQHMAQMDRRAEATKAFYAALTPQQKQLFDQRSARMMGGHGGERHYRGHHGHHG